VLLSTVAWDTGGSTSLIVVPASKTLLSMLLILQEVALIGSILTVAIFSLRMIYPQLFVVSEVES
jgi:hypothetical protein